MSVPTLTNAIIQPQNIILNQVPLTTVLPAVNAAGGVQLATALAPVTAMEQGGELKTGLVVETIPIAAPAGLVPMQAVVGQIQQVKQPTVAVGPQPGTSSASASADHNEVSVGFCRIFRGGEPKQMFTNTNSRNFFTKNLL